jgi:hypothetical protein
MRSFTVVAVVLAAILMTSCIENIKTGKTTKQEMEFTEKNQERLMASVPAPVLKDSLERRNLVKYLDYWNNADRLSYLYLLSRSGTVVGHYVIKGKITYCSSKLTTREQVITVGGSYSRHVVESPGLDGSYGPSEDAIFFFTAENPDVPVVWKGDYLVSGVPMNISTKPVLVRNVK